MIIPFYVNVLCVHFRECKKVSPISELTDTQSTALQRLSVELETVQREINSLLSSHEAKFRSLHGTFKEHQEFMIEQMRYNINTTIDYWGHSSLGRSDGKEHYIKEKMCMSVLSILNEFDNSSMKELKEMEAELKSIHVSITSSMNKCTGLQNDLKQFYEIIQKIWDNKEICFIASMKCEHKIQKALSVLGKSGKMFTVQGKSEHTVSDSDTCVIIAICVLPDGQVLLADWDYKKVKLLDQQYQVVSHLVVQADPKDMCLITPSEVAVTVDDNSNTHEVQFITVTKSQLVTGRKFQLQHECKGIAHHLGDLFICSGTALHKYSLSGKLVLTLYEDISSGDTGKIGH
ncbi:hypothetical protein DPMN_097433 [Dreissena polymorpha]|uniref:Uncharacterized protein n=1 Tax=Dreissena polymorpha TaxID=45954 RepID=A0A9D4LB94_DREPO|nr:hypothetical protein DPMN_097433 [Dreissena polymorpha]